MGKPPLAFEKLKTERIQGIYRAKIPGGWLMAVVATAGAVNMMNSDYRTGATFIPEPGHAWDGGSLV
jgi:hypothetical protein